MATKRKNFKNILSLKCDKHCLQHCYDDTDTCSSFCAGRIDRMHYTDIVLIEYYTNDHINYLSCDAESVFQQGGSENSLSSEQNVLFYDISVIM